MILILYSNIISYKAKVLNDFENVHKKLQFGNAFSTRTQRMILTLFAVVWYNDDVKMRYYVLK